MEFTYNSKDKENCWYKEICDKKYCGECDFCVRHYKMDFLVNSAMLEGKQRHSVPLKPEAVDKDAFLFLRGIKEGINDFVKEGKNLLIYSANTGNGKAQPLDSVILTDNGFVKLRDLQWGTNIYGEDGNLYKVLSTFYQGKKPVYRIAFSDGTSTECCDEHLWNVRVENREYTTVQLSELVEKSLKRSCGGNKYFIPVCKPLSFEERNLPIDPYLLGALLGDGCFTRTSISFSNTEDDIIERVSEKLCDGVSLHKVSRTDYLMSYRSDRRNPLRTELSDLGLLGKVSNNKFIPKEYLFNSYKNRMSLLRGIFDTDGTVQKNSNTMSITTVSKRLAGDIKFLVQSLGGVVSIKEKNKKFTYNGEIRVGKPSYECFIRMPIGVLPFSSIKHSKRFLGTQQHNPVRAIVSIEYVGEKECMCIKTSNPSGLYLTNDCIVTHNTEWSKKLLLSWFNSIWSQTDFTCRGLFVSMPKFVFAMKENISKPNEYFQYVNDNLVNADLVVWDEINFKEWTAYELDYMLNIISQRIAVGKSNIYTTNYGMDEISKRLGTRLASRIIGCSECVEFKGKDRRASDGK